MISPCHGRTGTVLAALTILLLIASCDCHRKKPVDTSWIGHPGYQKIDTNRFPLKNQVVVWRNPNSSKEQFDQWLSDLHDEVKDVQALAVCAHCDSDIILLYEDTLLLHLENQTVGSNPSGPSPGPAGGNGPTLYSPNYRTNNHAPLPGQYNGGLPKGYDTNYSWPKPIPGALTVAVFDSGLDSIGASVIATTGATCFDAPAGMTTAHGWNFVDNNANTQDDMADQHGTKVTKLILDEVLKYSAAGRPTAVRGRQVPAPQTSTVNILPVKVFDKNGNGTLFATLCAFAYASGTGARIANASFGFYHYSETDTASSLKAENMLGAFLKQYLDKANMLIVAAAGNDDPAEDSIYYSMNHTTDYRNLNTNRFYPAYFAKTYPNVIAVTTVARQTQKPSPLENASGTIVDIGVQCDLIARPDSAYVFIDPVDTPTSAGRGLHYPTITGSSFAAPIVTGRIAAQYNTLTNKTDKHVILPALKTVVNGRPVFVIDTSLNKSIVGGYLAP